MSGIYLISYDDFWYSQIASGGNNGRPIKEVQLQASF